jgi:hypothetical protein
MDLSQIIFSVQQIREVKRTIDNQVFHFVDYDIFGRSVDSDTPIKKRLRLIPLENPDENQTHSILLLSLLDEFGYNKSFEESLSFDNNGGEFQEGDAIYWRPDGIKEPWSATIACIKDTNNDGKVESNEIKTSKLKYWDFGRDTQNEAGNSITEWYVVEMDDNSGYFEIWIGSEINPTRISF